MNVGKLFQAKKLYWLLYPSKDIAPNNVTTAVHQAATAISIASGWRKELNCNVSYISPKSMFMLLERQTSVYGQDGYCCKILSTNGELGWLYIIDPYKDKDDIDEVTVQ